MLDPMFAPAARQPVAATPLERTTADGRRHCLQDLPEAATRDIPTPVLAVPMNCP